MVFCYQNCSDLLWKKIVLVIEKNIWNSRLKVKNFQKKIKITNIICLNSESSVHFLVTECFFNLYLEVSQILSIIQGCPDGLILRFTVKPKVLPKTLFHKFSPKFIKVSHGHSFFWPLTSLRPLEAKNNPQRPNMAWRSRLIEKSV